MSASGSLIYRCRRCEALFTPAHVPDVAQALECIAAGIPLPPEWGECAAHAGALRAHSCEDEHMGVADLIGGKHDVPPVAVFPGVAR